MIKKYYIIPLLFLAGCKSTPYAIVDGSQNLASDTNNYDVEIVAIDGSFESNIRQKNIKPGYHSVHVITTGPSRGKGSESKVYPLVAQECMRYEISAQHRTSISSDWEIRVLNERPIPSCTPSEVKHEDKVIVPEYASPQSTISCLNADAISNEMTPVILYHSLKSCVDKQLYDLAIYNYFSASAYAYFDTLRVSDKTAHEIVNIVMKDSIWTLSALEQQNFEQHLAQFIDSEDKSKACSYLINKGMPNYQPDYMTKHGEHKQKLNTEHNEKLWKSTLTDYLKCDV